MDRAKENSDEVAVVQVPRPPAGVIATIHGVMEKSVVSKNYLRSRLARARFWSEAHPIGEVMSVLAPKRDRSNNLVYEPSFSKGDLVSPQRRFGIDG